MGTKNDPGKYDCYSKAEPDEPIFTLRGRDPVGCYLVAAWAALRCNDAEAAKRFMEPAVEAMCKSGKGFMTYEHDKIKKAIECSKRMANFLLMHNLTKLEERLRRAAGEGAP